MGSVRVLNLVAGGFDVAVQMGGVYGGRVGGGAEFGGSGMDAATLVLAGVALSFPSVSGRCHSR